MLYLHPCLSHLSTIYTSVVHGMVFYMFRSSVRPSALFLTCFFFFFSLFLHRARRQPEVHAQDPEEDPGEPEEDSREEPARTQGQGRCGERLMTKQMLSAHTQCSFLFLLK